MKINVTVDTETHSVNTHWEGIGNMDSWPPPFWNKCSDKMPFNSKQKLVFHDGKHISLASYWATGGWKDVKCKWINNGDTQVNITHWCELPEPPEEDE